MQETVKDLKEVQSEAFDLLLRLKAVRNRIPKDDTRDCARLISIAITNVETSYLYIKEALEKQLEVPIQRYG